MKPLFTKGQLISWQEDRGFGFIKSNTGGEDVFLHISVLPKDSRRPKVGDVIVYRRMVTPKGKVRASKASIQEVCRQSVNASRSDVLSNPRPQNTSKVSVKTLQKPTPYYRQLATAIGLMTVAVTAFFAMKAKPPGSEIALTQPACTIKGNISINTGKKIYHLPGMEKYDATVIRPEYGEKWFCTETEAIEDGWTKATR